MKFKKLMLSDWRQFNKIEMEFHPRITIITGANGAGKSTILKILSQHFGWSYSLLSTPRLSSTGEKKFFTGMLNFLRRTQKEQNTNIAGTLEYDNSVIANLVIPESHGAVYNVQISNQQQLLGVHIQSHRQVQNYRAVENIPVNPMTAEQAYNIYFSESMNRYQGHHSQFSALYRMKEAIISMATFGAGNQYVQKNTKLEKLFLDFKEILSKVLPPSVGFLDISIRIPDVVIVTETGEFMIDAASGGVMSLIDVAWQIFLYSHDKEEFIVTIDEPENHLHPSMQRSILRRLSNAFPKAQFIVATHSPFVVSSVKDSLVYVLQYEQSEEDTEVLINRRISSICLNTNDKAATANEILREVLGVPVTLPEWAEEELDRITQSFNNKDINKETLKELREQLNGAGLGEYYPEALKAIIE
ncbi:AAA family ATPase [Methylotenera mobilis]|uniref:AAA family ATPase n=1 Tax=Methylotenera mobilis TaxID=359408 RepID=UPI000371499F|nr:ATP-binding protein [Methylotenera mobilis]